MHKDPLAHLPPEVRNKMREYFLEEAYPLVDQLEAGLLSLEKSNGNQDTLQETINEAFRAAHTIKGSAASTGFAAIAQLTHEFETALDVLRSNNQLVSSEKVGLLLQGIDHLRHLLSTVNDEAQDDHAYDGYIQHLVEIFRLDQVRLPQKQTPDQGLPGKIEVTNDEIIFQGLGSDELQLVNQELKMGAKFYSLFWILPENAFATGLDPFVLLSALKDEAKIIRTTPLLDNLPPIDRFDPGICYIGLSSLVTTLDTAENLRAIFEFCPDDSLIEVMPVEHHEQTALNLIVFEEPGADQNKNNSASINPSKPHKELIRVKPERLDSVMNLVGELITASNGLSHLHFTFR